ncbi:YkvA family protein [Virgibacillus halophilus]|uniref:YkvA family protein n=1 Tax=Tigheibacillus halophilus TaxID=361280 RepID=A0ABU5C452_9BACI|nr:YkvA family protein [Virgibacillus halophilus]
MILPADIIPDVIPIVGFTDDAAVILYAVYHVVSHIDDQVKSEAHERMKKIFGEAYDEEQEIDNQFKPED